VSNASDGGQRGGASWGLHVKGEISGSEDLYVYGIVEGLVQLDERKLTVGTTAKVIADIIAGGVVVCGNVKGNVRAKNRIEIKKDGSVIGDLTTPQILIEDGADFKGSIEIDGVAEKEADKNDSSQMPSTPPKATAAAAASKSYVVRSS
jgi:cytoskeletal protein CcmA (bactofilin family)